MPLLPAAAASCRAQAPQAPASSSVSAGRSGRWPPSRRAPPQRRRRRPDAFLRIAPDNTVTVICKHIEFGQGPYTGVATIIADELDADRAQIRVEAAPADLKLYGNNEWGGMAQGTGGSTAMANSWDELRRAGAEARARLVAAAAQAWGVERRRDHGRERRRPPRLGRAAPRSGSSPSAPAASRWRARRSRKTRAAGAISARSSPRSTRARRSTAAPSIRSTSSSPTC